MQHRAVAQQRFSSISRIPLQKLEKRGMLTSKIILQNQSHRIARVCRDGCWRLHIAVLEFQNGNAGFAAQHGPSQRFFLLLFWKLIYVPSGNLITVWCVTQSIKIPGRMVKKQLYAHNKTNFYSTAL